LGVEGSRSNLTARYTNEDIMSNDGIEIRRKEFGNAFCRIVIYVAEDNHGTPLPDFWIEIYLLGVRLIKQKITL